MPTISFQISNPGKLKVDQKALTKELRAIGNDIRKKTRALILANASTSPHIASKPGQAPASWTGSLALLLKVKIKGNRVTLIDTARQAKALEAGAALNNGSKLEARPYLSTVFEQMKPEIEKRLENALKLTKVDK
ncbi:hypothetical protein AD945_04245 [Gluconobacter albidus]|uniref:HK97 gp10 family phage protein n=1 Tax=Gluconobacter albidus TaxID=318683 RepID=A0A149TL91_9PROT|nr:hypothetical protein [Gluconobacter albidus]KXV49420.1 hypothetical protein AD945_04245 [Gluconobacter albidus]